MASPVQRQIMLMRRQASGLGQYDVALLEEKRQELARLNAELASVKAETARLEAVERGDVQTSPTPSGGFVQQAQQAAAPAIRAATRVPSGGFVQQAQQAAAPAIRAATRVPAAVWVVGGLALAFYFWRKR